MTTYRVDIGSPGAWNGRDGSDWSGNQYLGLSGLQYLADTVTVSSGSANVIHIKGTGDGSKLKNISTDNLSGIFVRGEGVTWDGGSSTGVASEISGNAPTVIEVITGTLADNDNLVGTTSGATCDVAGAPAVKVGLNIDTNGGTNASGWIKFIGVNSSGVIDGTYACIDMNSALISGIVLSVDMIWLQNIEVKRVGSSNFGIYRTSNGAGCVFVHCSVHDCASSPIFSSSNYYSVLIQCCFYNNGSTVYWEYAKFLFCSFHDNTVYGTAYSIMLFGCLLYDNATAVSDVSIPGLIFINNVIDGNSAKGFAQSATSTNGFASYIGNRITNHSGAGDMGIDANSEPTLLGWNYFEDNTTNIGNATLVEVVPKLDDSDTNEYDQADTNEGYTSLTDGSEDLNLRSDATLRRTAIAIPIT